MVDVADVAETVNSAIENELGDGCRYGYDSAELEREIQGEDAIFLVATAEGDEVSVRELRDTDDELAGEVVGSIGARVMDFETFDRYVGSAEQLLAESEQLSRADFPVCEVGRWYVAPAYQSQSIGIRLALALLERLPRLDTYPLLGEAWQRDDRENDHINLFTRFGATKVGTTRWAPPGTPERVGESDEQQVYTVLRHDRETVEQLHAFTQGYDTDHLVSMVRNLSLDALTESG